MKKTILKRLFIKICKILDFEIIDQNEFNSPTLEKELNEDLSIINNKSIVLPLGEVKITKKIQSILVILRANTDINVWDQNKKRLFKLPKIDYTLRSLNSLIKSIKFCKNKCPEIKFKITMVDDNSKVENLSRIRELINKNEIDINIIGLNLDNYRDIIKNKNLNKPFRTCAAFLNVLKLQKIKLKI